MNTLPTTFWDTVQLLSPNTILPPFMKKKSLSYNYGKCTKQ